MVSLAIIEQEASTQLRSHQELPSALSVLFLSAIIYCVFPIDKVRY